MEASQDDAWAAAAPTVLDVCNGRDGCVFAYGQSGSGKTHTMFDAGGIVRRALLALVDDAAPRRLEVRASQVEIMGHAVRCLIRGEDVRRGGTENGLGDAAAVEEFLRVGADNKRAAATELNDRSTRAHVVVTARLLNEDGDDVSRLVLVDLGGSERVSRSKVNADLVAAGGVVTNGVETRNSWATYYEKRSRLTETTNINLGLLALKRCTTALLEKENEARIRIPFMDHRLTQHFRCADISRTDRGDAAAATSIFRGDEARRHRRCDVDIWSRHGAATPRPRRGYSAETRRGDVEIWSRQAHASGTCADLWRASQ